MMTPEVAMIAGEEMRSFAVSRRDKERRGLDRSIDPFPHKHIDQLH
jgi:hypothetical protein